MIYIVLTDKIEKLGMSTRVTNRLHRANIFTIGEFIDLPEDNLRSLSNIGKKSFNEIISMRNELLNEHDVFCLVDNSSDEPEIDAEDTDECDTSVFVDKYGTKLFDIKIFDANLSVRAKNSLARAGYTYISEIIDFAPTDLKKIKNMGEKTVNEILEYLDTIQFIEFGGKTNKNDAERCASECMTYLGNYINEIYSSGIYTDILDHISGISFACMDKKITENKEVMTAILMLPSVYGIIKNKIKETLSGEAWSKTKHDIIQDIPLGNIYSDFLAGLIEDMLNSNELTYAPDGGIALNYPSVEEYINSLAQNQSREVLEERLKGKTLEEIGDELNITRERVRQILRDRLKKFPKVREDFYKRVFCEYDFSKDDFLISFGENKKVYSYLVMAYSGNKRNHKPIKYLLEDTSFSVYIRKCAEKAIYKDYIRVGDERIKRSRPDISDYIVKTFCVDEISIDDYIDIYNMFLADYNLEKDENLIINKNSYKNKLAESNIVLWGYGGSFRYYDIRSRDYADLLTTLNLEQYIDVEYSADKFVKEYPDLMKEYDIRNGYEFHNLLRKILPEEKRGDIRFRKMPMIEFGKVNRDKIVREFLFRHAPIRADELAEKYEEEYGVKARTVLANYVDCIKEYLHDGVYRVDFPELTYDKLQYMRSLLTEDYYTIDKLNDIFEREFPGTSEKYINAHTLFQIGFALHSGYIIKNKYSSAKQYFNELYTRDDLFEYTGCANVTEYGTFNELRQDYEIIEFSPGMFINIRRLNNVGITKRDIINYVTDVYNFVEHGEIFTIKSLRAKGHDHNLYMLGFDDCFYAALLSENKEMFSFGRISGVRVLAKGQCKVSFVNLIESILNKYEKIDIYDLIDMLENEYSISVDRYKVIEVINKSSMYYDSITESVYIDYDMYFDEI